MPKKKVKKKEKEYTFGRLYFVAKPIGNATWEVRVTEVDSPKKITPKRLKQMIDDLEDEVR